MATASLLQKVAAHETELLRTRDDAQEEARKIVEAAHVSAASRMQEGYVALEAEIARQRKAAAVERENERLATEKACAEKVARIRSESEGRLARVQEALLSQVLPR